MSTTAITITDQAISLREDIKSSLDLYFSAIDDLTCQRAICDALVAKAKQISVKFNDPDTAAYLEADEMSKLLRDTVDEIKEVIDPVVDAFNKAHKAATGIRTTYTGEAANEITRLKAERGAWYTESERLRRIAVAREQEEARLREQERLLEESRHLEDQGDKQGAAEILQEAITVEAPAVVIASNVPTVKGTSFRKVARYEVIDWRLLKPEFVTTNDKAIGATVRGSGLAAETIVGKGSIRVWFDDVPADRR